MDRSMTGFDKWKQDRRSTADLIEAALAQEDRDEEAANHALVALHVRGTRDVLDPALRLCQSPEPRRRRLAAVILGQLGTPDRTFPDECREALAELVRHDRDIRVLIAAVFAMGHREKPCGEPELIALRHHPNDVVRHGVAFSLCGATSENAVEALLELMDDPYELARDWATTSIGMTTALDGPEIRHALLRRASDDDEITRAEALHGLARRGDKRAVPYLLAELSANGSNGYLFEDAAKAYLGIDEGQDIDRKALLSSLTKAAE
jgi:HEAT repeat protein